jgi:tRNA threonylcarbamoyladenosine biosynthesis protein TsaB
MNTTLHLDTSETDHIEVTLTHEGKTYRQSLPSHVARAQTVLPLAETLLTQAGLTVRDIKAVTVVDGGTSYTGVRVGFAIANAIGTLLGVPVNGKRALAIPDYSGLQWTK